MDVFSTSFSYLVSHCNKELLRTKHVRIYRMLLFAGLFQSLDRKCKAKVLICSAGPRGSGVLRRMSQVLRAGQQDHKPKVLWVQQRRCLTTKVLTGQLIPVVTKQPAVVGFSKVSLCIQFFLNYWYFPLRVLQHKTCFFVFLSQCIYILLKEKTNTLDLNDCSVFFT